MGFFDEIKKKLAEIKTQKENDEAIKTLERYGSIQGGNLPDILEYSLDGDENVVVFDTIKGKKQFICKYLHSDIVNLRLLNSEQEDNGSVGIYNKHDLEITLVTGEKFELCHIYFIKETDNQFIKISQMKNVANIRDTILTFASVMSDEATKKWANSVYEQDGLLPVFDEKGEISIANIEANIETIRTR